LTAARYTLQALVAIFARPGEHEQRRALDELSADWAGGQSLLIRVFDTQQKPSIKRWAVEGLCAFQTDEAVDRIRTSFADKHMTVRLHSVSGIRRRLRYEFIPDLVLLLSDPSPAIRLNVLQTLVAMDFNLAKVHLVKGLRDEKAYVRAFAAKALAAN
jgi:HEAT repeat protein